MTTSNDIRGFFTECRRLAEQANDLKLQFAAMREAANNKGIDWSQLKALAAADVADEANGDHKKVSKLVAKADFASEYADILKLRNDERKVETRSSESSSGGAKSRSAHERPAIPEKDSKSWPVEGGWSPLSEAEAGVAASPLEANPQSVASTPSRQASNGEAVLSGPSPTGDAASTIPIPDVPPIASGQASHEFSDAEATSITPPSPSGVASQIPEADIPPFADRRNEYRANA